MKVNGKAGIFMEVYELPITPEESKNYHSFFYKLKALTLREWMRSYITAVIYGGSTAFQKYTAAKNASKVFH